MTTDIRKIGDLGEDIACKYLMRKGFVILERNYLKKWGEIDIVTKKDNKIHFIEVKTGKGELSSGFMPEDNAHQWKLEKMARVVETYVEEKKMGGEWQCDLITVELDFDTKKAKVKVIPHVI